MQKCVPFSFKVVHLQYGEGELKTNLGMLNKKRCKVISMQRQFDEYRLNV